MIEKILGSVSFVAAVFFGSVLMAINLKKRKFFALRLVVLCVSICAIRFGINELISVMVKSAHLSFDMNIFLNSTNCLLVMVFCGVSVCVCYRSDIWVALFCGSLGYCMQYVTRKSYDLIISLTKSSVDKYAETALVLGITAVLYFIIWLLGIRKLKNLESVSGNKYLILIAIFVAGFTVYLNSYGTYTWDRNRLKLFVLLFSMLSAIVTMILAVIFLRKSAADKEIDALKQIIHQERQQYRMEKTVIDTINIKCHDLKHQLMALDGKIPDSELVKLKDAVDVYDSIFKTDNKALDVVLTMKNLMCENKDINFTCIANGGILSFISETDIYSLFGNILDNSIEACDKVKEKEKRLISMTIHERQGCVVIENKNYFAETPVMVNGVPQTTKSNTKYHGFGIPSIKMLVEKYNGEMKISIKEDIFTMKIVFPQP